MFDMLLLQKSTKKNTKQKELKHEAKKIDKQTHRYYLPPIETKIIE